MEALNESSKLIAQVLEMIKKANETGIVSAPEMQSAQGLLEEALDKLTNKM